MNKKKKMTAGELSLKAASDQTRYDPIEVGHALVEDVLEQLYICAEKHDKIINEDEYFLILVTAGDPLLVNALRKKYCAFLYLPQPRPQQTVFLYNKHTQKIRRLWSLPDAKTMAVISEMQYVAPQWQDTKRWVEYFYEGKFFERIREEHGITHLSYLEFLDAHNKEVVKSVFENSAPGISEPFDFSKVCPNQVIDPESTIL